LLLLPAFNPHLILPLPPLIFLIILLSSYGHPSSPPSTSIVGSEALQTIVHPRSRDSSPSNEKTLFRSSASASTQHGRSVSMSEGSPGSPLGAGRERIRKQSEFGLAHVRVSFSCQALAGGLRRLFGLKRDSRRSDSDSSCPPRVSRLSLLLFTAPSLDPNPSASSSRPSPKPLLPLLRQPPGHPKPHGRLRRPSRRLYALSRLPLSLPPPTSSPSPRLPPERLRTRSDRMVDPRLGVDASVGLDAVDCRGTAGFVPAAAACPEGVDETAAYAASGVAE
jgi:hypothetical protein